MVISRESDDLLAEELRSLRSPYGKYLHGFGELFQQLVLTCAVDVRIGPDDGLILFPKPYQLLVCGLT